MDAWVDQRGRDLVAFVADCPAGPVYLKSFDVSDIKSNSNALISIVDGLVDKVGMLNVIQIIVCSASGRVGELGKHFAGNSFHHTRKKVEKGHFVENKLYVLVSVAVLHRHSMVEKGHFGAIR